jgi:hypothetical protein
LPDAPERVDFQGRSIVVYKEFHGGRVALLLIGLLGLQGCRCQLKTVWQEYRATAGARGQVEISSVQITLVSNSIREGIVFRQ